MIRSMLLDMTLTKLLIYMKYRESKNKEFSKYMHVILLPYASNVNNINQTEQVHVPIWIIFFAKEIRSIYRGLDHATFFFYYHQNFMFKIKSIYDLSL